MTNKTNHHSSYCVETYPHSGDFREVLELDVRDHGGNVLWRGKAGGNPNFRIPVRLVATKLGGEVASGDILCDWAELA